MKLETQEYWVRSCMAREGEEGGVHALVFYPNHIFLLDISIILEASQNIRFEITSLVKFDSHYF